MSGRINIIYTGGTFGMRRAGESYVAAGNLAELIQARLPELQDPSMPDYILTEYDEPLESANATPRDWYELADRIRATQDEFDGFVIIHGTDTLAYTASALSFLLSDFIKPVIITGSQIPLCEVRNDAQTNLLSSIQTITTGRLNEVAVCFGRSILRGNRATKINATELDAFASPNLPPLAEIGTDIRFDDINDLPERDSTFETLPLAYSNSNLMVLRLYPGMPAGFIDAVVDTGAEGIILRCYGAGTGPDADAEFMAALKRANDAKVLIVAVSQCLEGHVSLRRYAAGSALADAGVISGYDMTTEAAFTKMHALFAAGLNREQTAQKMQQNIRGELTAL